MRIKRHASWMMLTFCALASGCASDRSAGESQDFWLDVEHQGTQSVHAFRQEDPSMSRFFDSSRGYAVFPDVTKGAAGIGAAHGEGVLYEKSGEALHVAGYSELKQGTIGPQLGGQSFRQIVFFENDAALARFKTGSLEFAAQASAVAASKGAAASADYVDGVAVFIKPLGGLMFEAAIGGQKFSYTPKHDVQYPHQHQHSDHHKHQQQ